MLELVSGGPVIVRDRESISNKAYISTKQIQTPITHVCGSDEPRRSPNNKISWQMLEMVLLVIK